MKGYQENTSEFADLIWTIRCLGLYRLNTHKRVQFYTITRKSWALFFTFMLTFVCTVFFFPGKESPPLHSNQTVKLTVNLAFIVHIRTMEFIAVFGTQRHVFAESLNCHVGNGKKLLSAIIMNKHLLCCQEHATFVTMFQRFTRK